MIKVKRFLQFLKAEDGVTALELVEGINNKVRVIQRRADGIKDRVYLRLKILTCFLPDL